MKVGITLEDERGLASKVSDYFGQCKYSLIANIENNEMKNVRVAPNTAEHGGGGCVSVDEILKYEITHVIAGGMGMGDQNKFAQANAQVFGYSGSVKDAINSFISKELNGLDACCGHGE